MKAKLFYLNDTTKSVNDFMGTHDLVDVRMMQLKDNELVLIFYNDESDQLKSIIKSDVERWSKYEEQSK